MNAAVVAKATDQQHPFTPRFVQAGILIVLCAVLLLSSLTVNRSSLLTIGTNRFWRVTQIWDEQGFLRSCGLWLERIDPAFYRQTGAPGLYAYANSDTGFLIPIYLVEKVLTVVRGRPSELLFQLYSQLVILVGAFFLAMIGMRAAIRRGQGALVAGTLGLAAGVVYQNTIHNLHRAREIHHSTVFLTLMILALFVRQRWFESNNQPRSRVSALIAVLMFGMAVSDHVVNPLFLALALGALSLYRVSSPMGLKHWALVYLLPVVSGWLLFQLQLGLARLYFGVSSMGSPLLLRLGLGNTGFAHLEILTTLRPPWSWWGLGLVAAVSLVAVLLVRGTPGDEQNQRDLEPILVPILVWVGLASVFSEMVAIHPYIFDLFLIIPSVLLVFVHGPLLIAQRYPHSGIVALGVLVGAFWYVWASLAAYSRILPKL
jgi:hypothetical protein